MTVSDRRVKVTLDGDLSPYNRALLGGIATTKAFTKELDTSNDRATLLTQSLLAVGPAVVPISAAAIPAVAGLTNQLAFAAAGAGVMALAFSGIGDALKATNDYALEPTAANLAKMTETLHELGPAGRDFVGYLQELRPQLQGLQDLAQQGLLPGAQKGIDDLMSRLPRVEAIVGQIATGMGELIAEAGENLADPRWDEFFTFLETEARPTLIDMGRTLGNFAEGFANLWMAFQPVSANFSHSFLELARDFAAWTDGLAETEGFQEFVDYLNRVGPKAWDTLGALAGALLEIVEAAAPVGEAMLPVIQAVAESIGAIADSDLGPVVVGVLALTSAYARLIALGQTANSSALGTLFGKSSYGGTLAAAKDLPAATRAFSQYNTAVGRANTSVAGAAKITDRYSTSLKGAAKLAGGAGGLAFVMSDLDDKLGLANTAMYAMVGSVAGPWGAAIGGGIGLVKDFAAANGDAAESIKALTAQVAAGGALSGAERHDIQVTGDSLVNDRESLEASERLNAALDRNKRAAQDAAFSEAGLESSMRDASGAARDEAFALLENKRAKNEAADAAENAFSAETNYRRALKDAQEQAKSNSAGIEGSSDAALKNRDALDQLAGAWNRLADSGAATDADMEKARASFVKAAEGMGVASKTAQQLADDLFHLPSPNPKVTVTGLDKAYTQIEKLKEYLKGIKDEEVRINVRRAIESGGGRGHQLPGSADGGLVIGPGGPRDDLVPMRLSNREYVMQASSVEKYGVSFFDALNAGRMADGGYVGARSVGTLGATAAPAFGPSGPWVARLMDPTVAVAENGLMRLVDDRVEIGISRNSFDQDQAVFS